MADGPREIPPAEAEIRAVLTQGQVKIVSNVVAYTIMPDSPTEAPRG